MRIASASGRRHRLSSAPERGAEASPFPLAHPGTGFIRSQDCSALYLAKFVSGAKIWAHLDIMAANATNRPGRPEGGEATDLCALYSFIRERYG